MLYYDRIDISKINDLAKSNNSKECMICHYWFFNHGFKFQDLICNGRHDLSLLCLFQCCVLILLLSLLKMLIIVVLFITLANLKQLIY